MQSQSGDRINMTVRAVFFPCTYMSLFLLCRKMTRVTLGIKAGGLSTEGVCRPGASGVARPLLFETHPATRIRRTGLRTSVQLMELSPLDNTHLRRIHEQLRPIGISSFPHAVHDGKDLSLGIKPCMDPVRSPPQGLRIESTNFIIASHGTKPCLIA